MINWIIPIFLSLSFACRESKQSTEKETFTFNIKKPKEEKVISVKLKKVFGYQAMQILENSLNDTCMIGIMKIPPGKVGRLYKVEFFRDSISYKYIPYKAIKGKLKIQHSFSDY